MQRNKHNRISMTAGLLGAGTILSLSSAVIAAPRNDVKQERRDVKEARKDVKEERKDLRRANTPDQRRDAREDLRDAQRDLRNERQDMRQERRENDHWDNRDNNRGYDNRGYNNRYYPNQPRYGNNGTWNQPTYRPNYGYGQNNNGYGYASQTFTGVVTNVRSNQSFDVRIGNGTYNVYLNNFAPRQLNVGDYVRVYGVRTDNNDIRNASVSIISNR